MGFDNLITIGVIIYVIYSVKKFFSNANKKNNGNNKNAGWVGKIADFINDIKEEIEQANQESAPQKSSGYEDDDNLFWDDIREQSNTNTTAETTSNTVSSPEKVKLPPLPEESHRNFHGSHDKPGKVFDHAKKRKPVFKMKKSDLKKAVIWSEIISKPVGLRD